MLVSSGSLSIRLAACRLLSGDLHSAILEKRAADSRQDQTAGSMSGFKTSDQGLGSRIQRPASSAQRPQTRI